MKKLYLLILSALLFGSCAKKEMVQSFDIKEIRERIGQAEDRTLPFIGEWVGTVGEDTLVVNFEKDSSYVDFLDMYMPRTIGRYYYSSSGGNKFEDDTTKNFFTVFVQFSEDSTLYLSADFTDPVYNKSVRLTMEPIPKKKEMIWSLTNSWHSFHMRWPEPGPTHFEVMLEKDYLEKNSASDNDWQKARLEPVSEALSYELTDSTTSEVAHLGSSSRYAKYQLEKLKNSFSLPENIVLKKIN